MISDTNGVDDSMNDFAPSIDMMPSIDDTMDHTDDELLDLTFGGSTNNRNGRKSRESSEDSMRFIPSHFDDRDSDHGDDDDEETPPRRRQHVTHRTNRQAVQQDSGNVVQDAMNQAVASMIGSAIKNSLFGTIQNLAQGTQPDTHGSRPRRNRDQMDSRRNRDGMDTRRYRDETDARRNRDDMDARRVRDEIDSGDRLASDSEEDTLATSDQGGGEAHRGTRNVEEDTASLDIEEEFDFLDEYELGSSVEK